MKGGRKTERERVSLAPPPPAATALWQLHAADVRRLSPKGDDHRLQVGRAHAAAASAQVERAPTLAAPSVSRSVGWSVLPGRRILSRFVCTRLPSLSPGSRRFGVRPPARARQVGLPSSRYSSSSSTSGAMHRTKSTASSSFSPGWPSECRILVHPVCQSVARWLASPSGRSCEAEAADEEGGSAMAHTHSLTHILDQGLGRREREREVEGREEDGRSR